MKKLLILPIIFVISCSPLAKKTEETSTEPYRIAFGSCSKQDLADQQLWTEVLAEDPDLWIWLGDNIYADTEDMEVMKEKYDLQKSHPDYQQLMDQTDIIGIWDDHDYGANDVGKEYAKKDESRDILFDFLEVDPDNPAWNRKGAHQSYLYEIDGKKVSVILLDARYSRDSLAKDENNKNIPNTTGKVLGDEQWQWLTEELSGTADLFIIGSGIQVIPEEHAWEKWSNFPSEREKLFELIAANVKVPLVFLTGDRHISEVSKMEIEGYPYPLYDITSSSLTSPWGDPRPEANQFRIDSIIYDRNFTVMDIAWDTNTPQLGIKFVGVDNQTLKEFKLDF